MIPGRVTSSRAAARTGVAVAETESRLGRWSRLKSKGGADPREEAAALEEKASVATAVEETPEEFLKLPGGARIRRFVPAMAPLAPLAEEGDDPLTRGVGHAAEKIEAEVEAEAAVSESAAVEDMFAGIDETALSDEEKEIVAGLPPLDQLTAESDFAPFFQDGVPEFVKRQAMRVLWRAVPFFNVRDGLNDYDEDFNVVHKLIDKLTGNYRVGRGHLSDKELHDMMPEEARRAFDEEKDEDEEGDGSDGDGVADTANAAGDLPEKAEKSARNMQKDAENLANDPEFEADDTGDGEDDPTA
jgi:hypothetical protein